MTNLYRSEPMSYVRLLMTTESSYETLNALGKWSMFHPVDLPSRSTDPQASLDERIAALKKSVASCAFWEKKLETIRVLCQQYDVDIPSYEDVLVTENRMVDVVEEAFSFWNDIEQTLAKHVAFEKEQTQNTINVSEQLQCLQFARTEKDKALPPPVPTTSMISRCSE